MAEWRFLRGWSEDELRARLAAVAVARRNYSETEDEMTAANGWNHHVSTAVVAREPPGMPVAGGQFERAWDAVSNFSFSDPRIVRGFFDPHDPLDGRRMLLEARIWGLRYLGAVVVAAVRAEEHDWQSLRGYRYETLEGHFERGTEWFVVAKDHDSGEITFRIQAGWRRGDLPNWWSRLGFRLLVRRYQRAWHRLAHLRLRALLGSAVLPPLPRGKRLVQTGPDVPGVAPVRALAGRVTPAGIAVERDSSDDRLPEAS